MTGNKESTKHGRIKLYTSCTDDIYVFDVLSLSLPPSLCCSLYLPDLANVSISFRPFQCINEGGGNPYIGSEVIIDCMAEGEPFPQVTWFIMNRNLMDTEDPNVNFQQNNRILFISSLQSNHSGLYFCRSENNLFPFKQSPQVHLGFQG